MPFLLALVYTVLVAVVSVQSSPLQLVVRGLPEHGLPALNFAPGPNAGQGEFHIHNVMNVPGHSHTSFGHAAVNLASAPEATNPDPDPLYNSNRYSGLGDMGNDSNGAGVAAAGDPTPSVTLTFANGDDSAQPTKAAGLAFGDNTSEYILPSPLSDDLPLDAPQQALAAPTTTDSASASPSVPVSAALPALSTLTVPFDTAATPGTLIVPPPASFTWTVSTVTESLSATTITSLISISTSTTTNTSDQPSGTPPSNIAAAQNDVDQTKIRNIFIGIAAFFIFCGILFLFRKRILNRMCGPTQAKTEDEEFWVDTSPPAEHVDLGPKSAQVGLDTAIEKHRESLQINSPVLRPQTPGSNYTPTPKMQVTSPVMQQWTPKMQTASPAVDDRYTPLPPPRQPFPRMRVDSPAPGVVTAGMFGGRVTQGVSPNAGLPAPPALAAPSAQARVSIHPGDLWPGSRPY